jgi:hypothetical protein
MDLRLDSSFFFQGVSPSQTGHTFFVHGHFSWGMGDDFGAKQF